MEQPTSWTLIKAQRGDYNTKMIEAHGRFMTPSQRELYATAERVYVDLQGGRIRFVRSFGVPEETIEPLVVKRRVLFETKFEPRDAWVGLFWDRRGAELHVYVCPIPFLVLHWTIVR